MGRTLGREAWEVGTEAEEVLEGHSLENNWTFPTLNLSLSTPHTKAREREAHTSSLRRFVTALFLSKLSIPS